MGSAVAAQQQGVARGIVAGVVGVCRGAHQSAVGVLAVAGGDSLGYDCRLGVLADVYHLRACVGLLVVVGHGNAVELRHGVVAAQHARRVFPCNRRTGLHLCPRELGVHSAQVAALRHEVEHSALAVLVARIPVLHRGVFHLGIVLHDNLHDCGVELVLIAHRGGAALKIRHVGIVFGDDERALELSRVPRIDTEIGAQLHRAAHSLGDVYKRPVAEHGTVEGGIEVVAVWHHASQVFPHQVGVLLDGVTYRGEDHSLLGELLLERGLHRHRVHDGVHGGAAKRQTLLERYAELVECLHQLGVYLLVLGLLGQRVGIIGYGLVVHRRHVDVAPLRLLERLPVVVCRQSEFEHPLRLALLPGNEPYDVLVESFLDDVRMHISGEAELVFLLRHLLDELIVLIFDFHFLLLTGDFAPP